MRPSTSPWGRYTNGVLSSRLAVDGTYCISVSTGSLVGRLDAKRMYPLRTTRPSGYIYVLLSFYQNAANQLSAKDKDPTFFVFCTTLDAVKDKLELPGPVHYLTHDNGYVGALHTLWLISQCKHHIISNSSFYWWGAWLAERRHSESIVIACDLFTNKDTVPQRWTRLHLYSDY